MINPRSTIAVLFASLIVAASSQAMMLERAPLHRLSVVHLKLGQAERQAWIRAIGYDQNTKLTLMITQHDPRQLLSMTAVNGKTALMVASKQGDLPLAKALVKAGASIDAATETNGTAFMFASLGNHMPIAQWLHSNGADINVVGSNGWTAATIAAAKGHDDLLRWLIDKNAHVQVRDVYRFTPFMRAVENNHTVAAKLLLALPDTDINAQDEYDNTALHHAVSAGNRAMVELLLENGAKPLLPNRDGLSAVALASGNVTMEALLK